MLQYVIKRILYMIPTLFVISMVAFAIIQLPPGDYLNSLAASYAAEGDVAEQQMLQALEDRYGLNQPIYVQYWKWIQGILTEGDFGDSFEWNRPVTEMIWSRLGLTVIVSFVSLVFIWIVALPVGSISAVKQYSVADYIATFFGFVGLAIPNFMLALILMYVSFKYFGQSVGGLFSPEFVNAPWSIERFVDLLSHIWVPVVVIGTAGTAGLIRIMRANLLDELNKPYVVTARAKGLPEGRLLVKYPIRVALNPFVSRIGWTLPRLVSGEAIVSVVLSLPTTGPLLLRSLQSQDMYLAGSFILLLSVLTVVGTLLSDILLAWLDPRIRYER